MIILFYVVVVVLISILVLLLFRTTTTYDIIGYEWAKKTIARRGVRYTSDFVSDVYLDGDFRKGALRAISECRSTEPTQQEIENSWSHIINKGDNK